MTNEKVFTDPIYYEVLRRLMNVPTDQKRVEIEKNQRLEFRCDELGKLLTKMIIPDTDKSRLRLELTNLKTKYLIKITTTPLETYTENNKTLECELDKFERQFERQFEKQFGLTIQSNTNNSYSNNLNKQNHSTINNLAPTNENGMAFFVQYNCFAEDLKALLHIVTCYFLGLTVTVTNDGNPSLTIKMDNSPDNKSKMRTLKNLFLEMPKSDFFSKKYSELTAHQNDVFLHYCAVLLSIPLTCFGIIVYWIVNGINPFVPQSVNNIKKLQSLERGENSMNLSDPNPEQPKEDSRLTQSSGGP